MIKRTAGAVSAVLLVLGSLYLAGCTGSWGRLKTSPELDTGLNNRQIDPALAYFYCGRSGLPYAVVGIDKAYNFSSKFWFEIETMDEVYQKIANLADLEGGQDMRFARQILAPDGRVVGTYFSYYFSTAVKVDEGEKTVWVSNPYKPESKIYGGL